MPTECPTELHPNDRRTEAAALIPAAAAAFHTVVDTVAPVAGR